MTRVSLTDAPSPDGAFVDAALSGAPFGVALIDTELRCLRVNAAFAALSGLDPAALAGRRLVEALPGDCPGIEDRVREVLQSGLPRTNVPLCAAVHGDAPRRWNATVFPVRSGDGTLLGACCVSSDVTEVSALVDQFLQSQKLEAVGLLANLIAHDFNNLLTVIQGYSDLLLRDSSDAAKRTKRIEEIRTAAEAAGHLSRQLLTLSRRNMGVLGPVDANLLVRTIGAMLERILPANVAQELVLAENLGLTLADPGQVEQIVMNLITNAIDAMPAGGLLTIETANVVLSSAEAAAAGIGAGEYVRVTVTDTGVGMDAQTQARIFSPRFTTKLPGQGSGLGLSAVRAMVAQMHGRVTFVSARDQGSTFIVDLPRAVDAVRHAVGAAAPGMRAATIMVVEDHAALRSSILSVLENAGYTVIATGSGGEALQAAAAHQGPVDLLLADIELPDADGVSLAARLRTERPGLRVVLTSGLRDKALSPAGQAARADAFLSKPFAVDDLLGTIQATLHPAAAARPAATD